MCAIKIIAIDHRGTFIADLWLIIWSKLLMDITAHFPPIYDWNLTTITISMYSCSRWWWRYIQWMICSDLPYINADWRWGWPKNVPASRSRWSFLFSLSGKLHDLEHADCATFFSFMLLEDYRYFFLHDAWLLWLLADPSLAPSIGPLFILSYINLQIIYIVSHIFNYIW